MLQLRHLTIRHQKTSADLVYDLSISIQKGDKVAIIGEEGMGKSTLLSYLYNPKSINHYALADGEMSNQFRHISYLPQELPEKEKAKNCFSYLYDDSNQAAFDFNRCFQLAHELGFAHSHFDSQQTIGSLSGGEKLKLQLIKLLAAPSDLLLLDEPANDLDLESLQWLQDFIQKSSQTVIFISHDEQLLSETANKIIHLERYKKKKQTVTHTEKSSYLSYKTKRDKQFLKQSLLAKKERQERTVKAAKLRRSQSAVRHALSQTRNDVEGRLLAKKMKTLKAQERRFDRETKSKKTMPYQADIINIAFSDVQPLPAGKALLHYEQKMLQLPQAERKIPIRLTVRGQDKLAITGRNGVGKTSLLKLIYQELNEKNTAFSVGLMPQNYDDCWDGRETVIEFCGRTHQKEQALTYLASLQFSYEEIYQPINRLSGGQKAKLLLLQMLLNQNNILLLDEPTRSFSPTSQAQIRQMLRHYPGCIISVSHDRIYMQQVPQVLYELTETGLKRL